MNVEALTEQYSFGGKQSHCSCLSNFMRFHILDRQAHQKRYLSSRGLKVETQLTCGDNTTILGAIEGMNVFNRNHEGKRLFFGLMLPN